MPGDPGDVIREFWFVVGAVGNAAFSGPQDSDALADMLSTVAVRVRGGDVSGLVPDADGNTVGGFGWQEPESCAANPGEGRVWSR